jgi:hypothetical protein
MVLVVAITLAAGPASAQWVVYDKAVTTRNSITAMVKEYLLATQRDQHERLRRMAARLSGVTNLGKYAPAEPLLWRAATPSGLAISQAYASALYDGDAVGTAYMAAVQGVPAIDLSARGLPPPARRAVTSRLATIDLADATLLAAIDDVGRLRANGRTREQSAIDALEATVIDPSSTQSATAVLDKTAGAALIGARQRQARIQLLTRVVEQLLVDSKRERDTETSALNTQIVTWREATAANTALISGTADALKTWRQP